MRLHANRLGTFHILQTVIDEQAVGRLKPVAPQQQLVNRRIRLDQPLIA